MVLRRLLLGSELGLPSVGLGGEMGLPGDGVGGEVGLPGNGVGGEVGLHSMVLDFLGRLHRMGVDHSPVLPEGKRRVTLPSDRRHRSHE